MTIRFRTRRSQAGLVVITGLLAVALVACADEPGATTTTDPSDAVASVAETVQPAESEAAAQYLFVDADTVLGPENLTEDERPVLTCVQWSRFAHNEQVVWRVKVFDPQTGEEMDDSALATVRVTLPDQMLDLHYGPHPRDNPLGYFWTTSWVVPEDYPEGVINYTIETEATDGRTGTWEQFEIAAANLTVTEDVRPVIAQ